MFCKIIIKNIINDKNITVIFDVKQAMGLEYLCQLKVCLFF